MTVDMLARAIQLILAPVVMITSCAILLTGLLSHYAAINDRLRALARERLELVRQPHAAPSAEDDPFRLERLAQIDAQLPLLVRRHGLMQRAVLALYGAILVFVATMLVAALSVATSMAWAPPLVLASLLAGALAMLLGLLLTAWEIHLSQRAVQLEVERVMALRR